MKIDFTITISVILALAAIISPIIVSIINNKYQLKLKQIENYDIAKRNALEKYSSTVGEYITYNSPKRKIDMINYLYGLIPYFEIDFENIKRIVDGSDNVEIVKQESNKLLENLKKQL